MQQKFLSIQQLQDLYEKYSSKDIFDAFSSEFLQHLTDFQPLLKNQNDPWKKVDPYSLGYIDEAPLSPDSLNKKTRRPPDGYLCHLCFCKGHYIKDCPQVITVQVNCKIQNRSCPRAIVLFFGDVGKTKRRRTYTLSREKTMFWRIQMPKLQAQVDERQQLG